MGKRLISETIGIYSINDQRKPGKGSSFLRIDSGANGYVLYVRVRIQGWRMSDSRDDLQPLCGGTAGNNSTIINTIF